MEKNNLKLTGEIIAGHIFGTDSLKSEHKMDLMFKKIQRMGNPIEKLQAYLESAKYLVSNKSAYWQSSAMMFKILLKEKTDLAELIKKNILTKEQLEEIGLKSEGEIENWKLLCGKDERGKGFNQKWFCKEKIGISNIHIDRMIDVNDNFKKYGITKEQVDELGHRSFHRVMEKCKDGNPRVTTSEIQETVKKLLAKEITMQHDVLKESKTKVVFGRMRKFSKNEIKEFISYLKKDDRFNQYLK